LLASKILFLDYNKYYEALSMVGEHFRGIVDNAISRGDRVAVKVHMGEYGNRTYLRPPFVREFVELVKEAGGKPFVTDTTSLYPKNRFTAKKYLRTASYNGFTATTVGAPIVIADSPLGYNGVRQRLMKTVDGCEIKEIGVAEAIANSDAMIVLTHSKGHFMSGYGGAIKNIAMGCTTKDGKAAQHLANRVILDLERCNGCGKCVEACPFDAAKIEGGKHTKILSKCMSCSNCFFACTEGALRLPKDAKTKFQVNLAHAAQAVISRFRAGKIAYINFLQDITEGCDCDTSSGSPLMRDIGILGGEDPVAIDKASIDLIDKAPLYRRNLSRTLLNRKDTLGRLNGTSSVLHLQTAQKLGLGDLRYNLIRI
jgi:uncharacterized Fe-S center protein